MIYEFTPMAIKVKKNNLFILGNSVTGKWIRITENKYKNIVYKMGHDIEDEEIKFLNELGIIQNIKNAIKENNKLLKSIMIAVTNHCNLNCLHCGFSAGINESQYISLEILKEIIKNNNNIEEFIITGGEPLTYPDFMELTRYLNKEFFGRKVLMTNGCLFTNEIVKIVSTLYDEVAISLDGATANTSDQIRGKGVYDKVICTIKELQKNGMNNISLSMTVTKLNNNETTSFLKLCEKLGVKPILRDLFLVGRGHDNKSILYDDNSNDLVHGVCCSEERKNIKINGRCGAGVNSLYIQYDGSVYPCPVAAIDEKYKMSNNACVDLDKLVLDRMNNKGYMNFYSKNVRCIEPCKNCDVRDFCWGCLQEYFSFIEDKTNFKTFCNIQKNNLEHVIWGD